MLVLCVLFTLYIFVVVLFFSSENLNKNTGDSGSTMLTLLKMLTLLTLLKLFTNIAVVAYDGLWEPYAVIWMGWDDTPYSLRLLRLLENLRC